LYYKVLFMNEHNQPLETLQDIKRIMERSSRFISLSGLSGVAAGVCALIGVYFAYDWINKYALQIGDANAYSGTDFQKLKMNLILLSIVVLAVAIISAFFFTWRKARQNNLPVWDLASKRLIANMLVPIISGGLFILAMLQHDEWSYVVPASLIFYGIALVNAGKYTLSDIRYLGYCEIILGLISTQFIDFGLYFWAAGFGVLHIIYGFVMWLKYERVKTV
jgi:hypothetical protein